MDTYDEKDSFGVPPRSKTLYLGEFGSIASRIEGEQYDDMARIAEISLKIPSWKQEGCERCATCIPEIIKVLINWSSREYNRYTLIFQHLQDLISTPMALKYVIDEVMKDNSEELQGKLLASLTCLIDNTREELANWKGKKPGMSPLPFARLAVVLLDRETRGALEKIEKNIATSGFKERLIDLEKVTKALEDKLKQNMTVRELTEELQNNRRSREKRICGGGRMTFNGNGQGGVIVDFSLRHLLAVTGGTPPDGLINANVRLRPFEMPVEMVIEKAGRGRDVVQIRKIKEEVRNSCNGLSDYWLFSVKRVEPHYYYCLLCKYLWSNKNNSEERFVDRFDFVNLPSTNLNCIVG